MNKKASEFRGLGRSSERIKIPIGQFTCEWCDSDDWSEVEIGVWKAQRMKPAEAAVRKCDWDEFASMHAGTALAAKCVGRLPEVFQCLLPAVGHQTWNILITLNLIIISMIIHGLNQGGAQPMHRRALELLQAHGIKTTKQRLALGRLLFEGEHRHVTADLVYEEAKSEGVEVSLATVYNTLHQFARAGMLREVAVDLGQSYFDTNTSRHHHFFDTCSGKLIDIPEDEVAVDRLPEPPDGQMIDSVEVIIRISRKSD